MVEIKFNERCPKEPNSNSIFFEFIRIKFESNPGSKAGSLKSTFLKNIKLSLAVPYMQTYSMWACSNKNYIVKFKPNTMNIEHDVKTFSMFLKPSGTDIPMYTQSIIYYKR